MHSIRLPPARGLAGSVAEVPEPVQPFVAPVRGQNAFVDRDDHRPGAKRDRDLGPECLGEQRPGERAGETLRRQGDVRPQAVEG